DKSILRQRNVSNTRPTTGTGTSTNARPSTNTGTSTNTRPSSSTGTRPSTNTRPSTSTGTSTNTGTSTSTRTSTATGTPRPSTATNNSSPHNENDIAASYDPGELYEIKHMVGRGYNLLNSRIFDVEQMPEGQVINFIGSKNLMSQQPNRRTDVYVYTENSVSKVSKTFEMESSIKGSIGLFSASFSNSYKTSSTVSTEKAYSKIMVYVKKRLDSLSRDLWKNHLHPDFVRDLNSTMAPKDFFKKYGTHLILKGVIGGRMELNCETEKRMADTCKEIKNSLSVAIGNKQAEAHSAAGESDIAKATGDAAKKAAEAANIIVVTGDNNTVNGSGKQGEKKKGQTDSLGVSIKTTYTETTSQSADNTLFTGFTVGGNGQCPMSLTDYEKTATEWILSLSEEKDWAFCGIPDSGECLYPLWDLANSSRRRDQLKLYFDEQASLNAQQLTNEERYVTDIKLVWAKNENDAKTKANNLVREGYAFIERDLNKGVSGSGYLYLCYKTETLLQMQRNGHRPYTNFFIYCDDKNNKSWQYGRYNDWVRTDGIKVTLDGITIENKNYDYIGDYWTGSDSYGDGSKNPSNLNHGKVTSGRFILLSARKDTRFNPIKAMNVYYEDEYDQMHQSKEWIDIPGRGIDNMNDVRTSANAGHSNCTSLYLVFKRSDENIPRGLLP
ncbi:MAG: hypothetical protein IJ072_08365, partial [Oscillospiraceae bacterium]|nr:hypothetical protein [Oscillospiraceae bacterium]